jgi:hypothetical protein
MGMLRQLRVRGCKILHLDAAGLRVCNRPHKPCGHLLLTPMTAFGIFADRAESSRVQKVVPHLGEVHREK